LASTASRSAGSSVHRITALCSHRKPIRKGSI
jgi:hypothetical protein